MKGTLFLGDEATRKKLAMSAICMTLVFLHIWATVLVVAAARSTKDTMDGETIRLMFSSIVWGIGFALAVLISDKVVDMLVAKFGGIAFPPAATVTETATRTITSVKDPKEKPNAKS